MTLTAAALAKLAFDAVIQTGVGKLTEAALKQGKILWQKIRGKVKEEGVTEAVLVELEQNKSLKILEEQVIPSLREAMLKYPQFAQEIRNIAQPINQEISGAPQDVIEQKDFQTHDNSAVVGKAEGQTQNFGGNHFYLQGKN